MQVNSSVNARYYTSYQTERNVKYCAAITQTEDEKITPNEMTENPGYTEFVDYQEFHKARMSQNGGNKADYYFGTSYRSSGSEESKEQINNAVTIAESEDEGEFLGLTMVPEEGQSVTYGMRAMLSDKSTPDNPIVQVVSNLGGKKVIYNVEVNKVNPDNATQLEMFALLSYTDKMGITDGGTFGSHQQLEVYGQNAGSIGYCSSLSGADAFLNEKFNWTSIMEKMVQVYQDAGMDKQAEDCKALVDLFDTITTRSENTVETETDFSRFAPNAPDEVKQAFMEAANETGYYEYSGNEKMDHISQILVRQVENRMNGVENPQDVFGSTVASALQAAREMLYDLENPFVPVSQRGENAAEYIEREKEFYRAFIEKLEGLEIKSVSGEEGQTQPDGIPGTFAEIMEWINSGKGNAITTINKIVSAHNPEDGQIYRTFFTDNGIICSNGGTTAWTLELSDEQMEIVEEYFKEYKPEYGISCDFYSEEALGIVSSKEFWLELFEEAKKENVVINDTSTLLTTESTSCTYETADPDDDDIRYITWYTEEGIFCRKAGQTSGYEWSIAFENKEQYDKVMEFIGQFPSDWNMRFAAHENFWNDFLNDEIDIDGFMEFMDGTNKGIPDFSITKGDSVYVDKDKVQWAKYTNPLGARFYTAKEMHQMQMEIITANEEKRS